MKTLVRYFPLMLGLMLTACSSGARFMQIEPPSNVVSDSIVVPGEIMREYNSLASLAEERAYSFERFYKPELALMQPLEDRRAYLYLNFSYMRIGQRDPVDSIQVRTIPGGKNQFDGLVKNIANQLGFSIFQEDYNDYDDFYWSKTTDYSLRSNGALSIGELAWAADWVLSNHHQQVLTVEPVSYIYPAALD